jgi:hypothetical protein
MKFLPALLIICLLTLSLFVTDAHAQTRKDGSLTISPAYVEVSLTKPGEELKLPITFTNSSSQQITLEVFPLDFNSADTNGTIGFIPSAGSYSYSLASFLSLEADQITIEPKEKKTFTVLIRNRPDLAPGGHYAAIVGKVVSGKGTEFGANVAPSLSSLIFLIKTGGERYNLSLNRTDQRQSVTLLYPDSVQLEFQNEGNVHLVPYGILEIRDSFGRLLKRGVLNTSSFFVMPESRRHITVQLHADRWSFPVSFNTMTIRGNDSLHKTTFLYRNSFLYINPLVPVAIALIGALWIILKRRRALPSNKNVQTLEIKQSFRPKIARKKGKKI